MVACTHESESPTLSPARVVTETKGIPLVTQPNKQAKQIV
jgi:hypothetical protein